MSTMSTSEHAPQAPNMAEVQEEFLELIQSRGLLAALGQVSDYMLKANIAEVRDNNNVPVGEPIDVSTARRAAILLWQNTWDIGQTSTNASANMMAQYRVAALRQIAAEDIATEKLLRAEYIRNKDDRTPLD